MKVRAGIIVAIGVLLMFIGIFLLYNSLSKDRPNTDYSCVL